MSQNNRTWRDNAAEFAALDRGEGWQFAILVACSVERQSPGGDRRSSVDRRMNGKASIVEFSGAAGTSESRVRRYLDAWREAAEKGWVQDASTLTPAMSHDLTVPDRPWRAKDGGVYDASKTGGQINDTEQIAAKAAKDPEYAARVLGAVAAAATPEVKRETFATLSSDAEVTSDAATRHQATAAIEKARTKSDFYGREAIANERDEADKKNRGGVRAAVADGLLSSAKRKIREAAGEVHEANLSDDARQMLLDLAEEVRATVDLFVREVNGVGAADWDAELAALIGGDQ